MNNRSERLLGDVLLVVGLAASFLTHEQGVVLHSVVSIVFAALALHHVKHNWRAVRHPLRRGKRAANLSTGASMALAVATGLALWLAGEKYSLGHGPISVAAAVSVVPHVVVHRRSLLRLVRRGSPDDGPLAGR